MNYLCPPIFQPSGLFRSYRARGGHQPVNDDSKDEICCVRVWTVLGFFFLPVGLIMVASSYIKNSGYDLEIALTFIVGTCLVFAVVLGYICRFWWKMRTQKKENPEDETDSVGDYIRDIFCLPPNFRERTEPEGGEVVAEIITSC